jgi:ATP-dependent DNA helicase RecQ
MATDVEKLLAVVRQYWGYSSLRPLQEQAMLADLQGRDSLVVLPTGGGKSLCYQAPAALRGAGKTTVVISPLISLMKDQVDSLRESGVPAAQIDSSLSSAERSACERDLLRGAIRLLFVSPERLVNTDFYRLLQRIDVRTFAIDEAHCISHWGHDFRPEYRQLNPIREVFPRASIHAYTATATEQVRQDIVKQLNLRRPEVLVGNFDRPNLTYRVLARRDLIKQVQEVLGRHVDEAGIIYCLRRSDVDELTRALRGKGWNALPYHAGLEPQERQAHQEAFAAEECDLVVATVAFGMGIDRSNIRFVLHTAMPKSIEHYQQETGRAGRDGLEAECVLLHSGSDFVTWKSILEKSAAEPGVDASFLPNALKHLDDMDRYCRGAVCRHQALVQYFGQSLEAEQCSACDLCLGDTEEVPDALIMAQKILSCVARVQERFGVGHVISVLRGENTEKVRKFRHEQLTTYGLLKEHSKVEVRDWIFQLIGQKVLEQKDLELASGDKVPILGLNDASWAVMRKQRSVRLVRPTRREKPQESSADTESWEGVDRELFAALSRLRRQVAEERNIRPYLVFSDATLRELAQVRPSNLDSMRLIYGIGEVKLRDHGERFLQAIADHCRQHGLTQDNCRAAPAARPASEPRKNLPRPNPIRDLALEQFRQGASIPDVMHQTGRSRGTVSDYLCAFIQEERPANIDHWVTRDIYQRVAAAVRDVGADRLKPIFVALNEQVSYDDIRLVVAHLTGQQSTS